MGYDEQLAGRIRRAVSARADVVEKKMFGGLAFLLEGKMFCGIVKNEMMVRVGPERYGEAMQRKGVRPMDFTGRRMKGYVFVGPAACRTTEDVRNWTELGAGFVATLERGRRSKKKRSETIVILPFAKF